MGTSTPCPYGLGDALPLPRTKILAKIRHINFTFAPMNKAELALRISEKLGIPKKTAEDFVELFEDIITKALVDGNEVTIAGFGTFSSKVRSARMGVNPQNPSEKMQIPAVRVPKFKAGKALKDALKKPKATA